MAAVSHQWFFQWSTPSVIFTDITHNFDNIKASNPYEGGYYPHHLRSEDEMLQVSTPGDSDAKVAYNKLSPFYRQTVEKDVNHNKYVPLDNRIPYERDSTRFTGLTLWMTMLSLARGQSVIADTDTPPFTTLYKWKQVDFEFESPRHRRHAIAARKYIPENVLPLGLEVWGSRVFITVPRWRTGIPATLATVPRAGGLASPPLKPYPNWDFHRTVYSNNCSGLTSVFRISADPCGRLWVLDSGQIDSQENPKQKCPPSIVVFDLDTDRLIYKYMIPPEYVLQSSLFSNIIVDTREYDCRDLHVYIADTWRFGLIVFRHYDKKFWRFSHHLFYPDPLASNFTLHSLNFRWSDGIFGLSLSPVESSRERVLFFHPLSSYRQFMVSTNVLRDPKTVNSSTNAFSLVGEERGEEGQASASAMDRKGVMYYGLVSRDSVGCWDTNKPYVKNTMGVVAMNRETLVYPNDIKVDQGLQQILWVISNRLPMYQAGQLELDDYNYRLLFVSTEEAVRGTVCDPNVQVPKNKDTVMGEWWPSLLK